MIFRLRNNLIIACALGLSAWTNAAEKMSVVDDRGVMVAVPVPAERIAAVSYFAADVAKALGKKIVASTYMVEGRTPEYLGNALQDVTWIGQRATPNLELLAKSQPDVVIAMRRYTEGVADEINKFAPYVGYDLELFADSDRKIVEMGAMLGETEKAQALNKAFAADMAAYRQKLEGQKPVSFAVMWGGEIPWVFRNENMTAAILLALGATNVAGANPNPSNPANWGVEMSLETLLDADPEVIFVYDYGPDRPHEGNPVWQGLSAVKNKRVHYVGDHWVETHGPLARQMVLREGAHLLYPGVFPAVDIAAETQKVIDGK